MKKLVQQARNRGKKLLIFTHFFVELVEIVIYDEKWLSSVIV
jgi:hypothetical protein